MRFLIVDHYYTAFARTWFDAHPGLKHARYSEQRSSFESSMFGGTAFEAAALRELGHEAEVAIINIRETQAAWAREHGIRLPSASRLRWRRRRGLVPWATHVVDQRWMGEALLAQVEAFKPDAIHVQSMDVIDPSLIPLLRDRSRLVSGQIAAPISIERVKAGYDLIVSSLPNYVDRFRAAGADAEWLPLAFDPSIPSRLGQTSRDVGLSFVGSLFSSHSTRQAFLESVAAATDIDVWAADEPTLETSSPIRRRLHRPVWGAAMYRVLAASRLTLNVHIDIAEEYANNLRLYEGTGMGALLVTDAKVNLGQLFDPEREVVTFSTVEECIEKVAYYQSHPAEAAEIAQRGQARTLRDHTWVSRMTRLSELIADRL